MQTVVVTGATKGIGRAIAQSLLAQGHCVIGIGRDFKVWTDVTSDAFVREVIDLSDQATLEKALASLSSRYPHVSAVVGAAGIGRFGSLEEFSLAQVESILRVNFLANVALARAFVPLFKQRERGDVVFIGSEAALRGTKKGTAYCASKFALRGFAQALSAECAASGVRVALVNPGMTRTDFFESLSFAPGANDEEAIEAEDVAQVVMHVLSARPGTRVDEINLSPQKHVIRFKRGGP